MTQTLAQSPSQTIGPLYGFALMFDGSENAVEPGSADALQLVVELLDGGGSVPYPESMIEVWQGEQWARGRTDEDGNVRFTVAKPGPIALPDGSRQAPHLNVTIFARGLLKQFQTRIYFPDETEANAADPVLAMLEPQERETLIASDAGDELRLQIRLQGAQPTVGFEF
jgi:protocatechuate 3,4-dioxygenase alpha subunit